MRLYEKFIIASDLLLSRLFKRARYCRYVSDIVPSDMDKLIAVDRDQFFRLTSMSKNKNINSIHIDSTVVPYLVKGVRTIILFDTYRLTVQLITLNIESFLEIFNNGLPVIDMIKTQQHIIKALSNAKTTKPYHISITKTLKLVEHSKEFIK